MPTARLLFNIGSTASTIRKEKEDRNVKVGKEEVKLLLLRDFVVV